MILWDCSKKCSSAIHIELSMMINNRIFHNYVHLIYMPMNSKWKTLQNLIYLLHIWIFYWNLRSIDINIVCGLHNWTVKAETIAIKFAVIQPWPLLLKIMLSDFDIFSGFISCKLNNIIHMFSRVRRVIKKKNKKKVVWDAAHVCIKTHKSRWHSYS
jgi:hypothetical protein